MTELLANDPWFQAFTQFQFYASIAALIFLIARWRRNGEVLQYAPRRPVPWGVAGGLFAVAFTALHVSAALAMDSTSIRYDAQSPQERALNLAASMVMQSLGPILLLIIAATTNANWSDIGLPTRSAAAWARDVAVGAIACLAAPLPVGLAYLAANWLLKLPNELTKHSLVEMLTQGKPDSMVWVLAIVTAVVVAPIAEEITFRLLLQGWLEKWEDRRLGWRCPPRTDSTTRETSEPEGGHVAPPAFLGEDPVEQIPVATVPPKFGVAGLPYGWTPIILSSLLFAAAHYGYGPEPVPLFVLALFLGYCYQRTHRIIPCIVAHGLFNLLSMIALWRLVIISAE